MITIHYDTKWQIKPLSDSTKEQIRSLVLAYWDFLDYLDSYNRHEELESGVIQRLKLKREAMNDFANLLLSLHMGRKVRELDVRILNALNLGCQTQAQIAKELGVSERTIKSYYPDLKAKGLIKTKKHVGTELTEKGKRALQT